ncbi:MAG: hypothetical protein ACJAXK_002564 [Yoonia sp.]|jgi:hypothetical protein
MICIERNDFLVGMRGKFEKVRQGNPAIMLVF